MSDLPNGWVTSELKDIALIEMGQSPESRFYNDEGIGLPFFQGKTEFGVIYPEVRKWCSEPTKIVESSDILLSVRAPVGPTNIASARSCIGRGLAGLRAEREINQKYLFLFLRSIESWLSDQGTGTTFAAISGDFLRNISISIAPSKEQTRIVEKLEELLSDLDAGVAELKAAQKKLGQYRQSLLKAAVEGALTAEWRAAQRSAPLSPRGRRAGREGASTSEEDTWFCDRARELRQAQTPAEQALWQQLRAKRFAGFKFRRQQVLGTYIIDFVCFAQKLIVELDGSQHAKAAEYDKRRDTWLEQQGFYVLRFWNNEWATQPEAVLEAIWRALQQPPLPNPSPARGEGADETGAQLLARILTKRRARWEAKQLAKFTEQGKAPPKDWQKKYPEPVQPDTSDLPDLPEGWVWASVDQLAAIGTGVTPLKSKSPYYLNGDIPWVTSGALNNEMVTEATEYITLLALTECRLELYPAGALLVAMYGEGKTRGKCSELAIPATINQAIAVLVLGDAALACKPYLKSFLLKSYDDLRNQASGGVQPNLNLQIVRSISIPLPSLEEQRAITDTLHSQLEATRDQGSAIDYALKQSAAQRKNILKAAFSGQLVPQDPNDEPASVLLEHIRAERADREASKKPRGRKIKEKC